MKLCRYGNVGEEKPGLIDKHGRIRDLSGHLHDLGPADLSPRALQLLRDICLEELPLVSGTPRLGSPLNGTSKFVAIGLNYVDHAKEAKLAIPDEPVVFMKAISCIMGPCDDIVRPRGATKLDWEVELGVVIGTKAQYVSEADALEHVAGYCVLNDVSERSYQMQSSQWDKGKGCDTFGPIGPWLVTRDEVADPQNLGLWLEVNGKRMQQSNTNAMIFPVAKLVAYVSRYMTLYPGDVIATGTPAGVGVCASPQVFLKPGDTIRLGIDGLGEQTQTVKSRD
ncbi:fumarylacetoacetate hydrolase family protein [Caballeronia zhejiangensis]|uniref:2-hydroxyhepta-2,4-diene-1,7-dioate isomerase n=1 Tax=Caballeronia zhejiangensis TaxID=871203 RepID=A0A656QEV7_9BURK|nr:fumarylacetoacetate hydrolase family protein [Caballeronia zhejiangensis]KDR27175.1 2-hydroxyhepta-2,4-diene-1,7-dioate isomerase [Caballeronia zhejiangensis]